MHSFLIALLTATFAVLGSVLFAADATPMPAALTLVTVAELLIVTGAQVTIQPTTGKAVVRAWVLVTPGTNTTAISLRIYRNVFSAPNLVAPVFAQAGNFAVGSPAAFTLEVTDILTNVGAVQYILSVQQTGASANGVVNQAVLETQVLSG